MDCGNEMVVVGDDSGSGGGTSIRENREKKGKKKKWKIKKGKRGRLGE